MSLNGKVALVTGGAQGIGRAVVHSLLQSAAKTLKSPPDKQSLVPQVAVVDLNKTCGEESKAQLDAEFGEGNCNFIPCDVSNGDALRAFCFCGIDAFQSTVDQFGRLDIVINNAGINNEKNWEKTIQVNLTSVINGTYLALEHMSKEHGKEGGTIINVSSMAVKCVSISMDKVSWEWNPQKEILVYMAPPSLIAEGMMRMIIDTSLNGAVMKITCSKGIHFHTYEP
ncbi:hypothetical protein FQN60_012490, partial [Etheostoma spectabile]